MPCPLCREKRICKPMASIKPLITIPTKKEILAGSKIYGLQIYNSNDSEEKENTGSKQKKGKELEVTGLIREKSFAFLSTDYLEFTAEN